MSCSETPFRPSKSAFRLFANQELRNAKTSPRSTAPEQLKSAGQTVSVALLEVTLPQELLTTQRIGQRVGAPGGVPGGAGHVLRTKILAVEESEGVAVA